jgi:hypothetical protein
LMMESPNLFSGNFPQWPSTSAMYSVLAHEALIN